VPPVQRNVFKKSRVQRLKQGNEKTQPAPFGVKRGPELVILREESPFPKDRTPGGDVEKGGERGWRTICRGGSGTAPVKKLSFLYTKESRLCGIEGNERKLRRLLAREGYKSGFPPRE